MTDDIHTSIDHGDEPSAAAHAHSVGLSSVGLNSVGLNSVGLNSVGPGHPFLSASWLDGAIRFERSRWRCAQASRRSGDVQHHRLALVDNGGSQRTTIRIDGSPVYRGRDWPEALSFVPAGVERSGTYVGVDLTYSALRISPSAERTVLGSNHRLAFSPFTNVRDPVITCLLRTLGEDLVADRPPATAYVEHLVALILCRLESSSPDAQEDRRHRPLEAAFIRQTDEYIRAHLGEDIAVGTLAGLCGMRPDTFARRFRAATGKAPYAYMLACRIDRAQQVLRTAPADLASLALDLGFASQSHLTTVFRNMVGVTPGRYRAQYRPKS
jgi:AraC family transcriptional regulator